MEAVKPLLTRIGWPAETVNKWQKNVSKGQANAHTLLDEILTWFFAQMLRR
jgi:hypothetical protein